ncbi:MAG: hypothetical protein GF398_10275 [Chitinivibrionales bacterium]|nr:hypothetical protein [Chitinivibrionales bacterium]
MLGRRVADDQKMDKLVNLATSGCSDIVSLSSNLLDIARMDDGKLVLKRSVLEMGRILQLMDKFMQNALFEEKNISVAVTPPDGDFDVYADAYLLERIFQNLFSNAAKYVPNGGNVEITFANADNERIICFYSSGPPIGEGQRKTMFEKFSRLDEKGSQYSKGLGLFFCKMVMNEHRGNIWVDADESGNHFKLSFPDRAVVQARPARVARAADAV